MKKNNGVTFTELQKTQSALLIALEGLEIACNESGLKKQYIIEKARASLEHKGLLKFKKLEDATE